MGSPFYRFTAGQVFSQRCSFMTHNLEILTKEERTEFLIAEIAKQNSEIRNRLDLIERALYERGII